MILVTVEPLCYTLETNIKLYVKYTSILKKGNIFTHLKKQYPVYLSINRRMMYFCEIIPCIWK